MADNNEPESFAARLKRAINIDGWSNVLTSIGIKNKDKRLGAEVKWCRGTREDFNHFYSADDLAGRIVDIIPEDALKKGYTITGIEDKAKVKQLEDRLKAIKLNERALEAWKLARVHGGAGMIKVTEDAQMDQPAPSPKAGKKILALNVVDRWGLVVSSIDIDAEITSPTYKEPISYSLQVSEGSKTVHVPISASRVVRYNGAFLPRQIERENGYWGDSILTKLKNAIRNYQISHDAAAVTVQDFDIPVLKLNNMAAMIAAGQDADVIKRLEMINIGKSVAKMMVIDAQNEEFEHKGRNVTGLKDVLEKIESRLVTASNMPRTKLLGEQAGGLGGTGVHESSNWFEVVEAEQENYLKPKLLDVIGYVAETEFGIARDKIGIEFIPLWQESEKEEAERKKLIAETDKIYMDSGVVDPTEVANSRWGSDKYSPEMTIDQSLRKNGVLQPSEEDVAALKKAQEEADALKNKVPKKEING